VRKATFEEFGPAEVIKVIDARPPVVSRGHVLVDVEAAGINYIDVYQREGHIDIPRPFTPGFEGVGTIRAVGSDITAFRAGERVAWINVIGSYAEQVLLPVEQAIRIPRGFTIDDALLFQGVTAQYLLAEYRQIKPGDTVLVHAAAGGVGQILVQWLKHIGATVIGTASSEEKLATIRALGADHAVNYVETNFLDAVRSITGGRGVELALDAVGRTTFSDTVKALARRGMAISYGRASGTAPDVEVLPLILRGLRVAGASLFEYIDDPAEMQGRAAAVVKAIEEGWLKAPKTTLYPLSDVVSAHRAIEGRSTQGKLALLPGK
jgi:NADPH2:quinone reductase